MDLTVNRTSDGREFKFYLIKEPRILVTA